MLVATLLIVLSGPAARPDGSARFPGGVLSPSGRAAYLCTDKGLLAVDLRTGGELWRSELSQRPLFVAGDRLYSLAVSAGNEVRVIGHDLTRRGARASRSGPVVLPRWAAGAPGEGQTFTYTFRQQRHELTLEWRATARAAQGPAKEARGLARIDLRTGHVRSEEAGGPAAAPAPPRVLEKLAVRWHRVLAGQVHALVTEATVGGLPRLVLRAWELPSGKLTVSRELLRARDVVVMVGADDRHLWLRDSTPNPGRAGADAPRSWAVFSGVDGRLVATVPVLAGTREAVLLDGRAYFLTARARRGPAGAGRARHVLHAYDLEAGKVLWTAALDGEK